jgi:hypothetical protein
MLRTTSKIVAKSQKTWYIELNWTEGSPQDQKFWPKPLFAATVFQ